MNEHEADLWLSKDCEYMRKKSKAGFRDTGMKRSQRGLVTLTCTHRCENFGYVRGERCDGD